MKSILIIDDEAIDCLILTKLIEKGNHAKDIVSFNSPILALDHIKKLINTNEKFPTHIFVDINMPGGMNGFKFIEEYLNVSEDKHTDTKVYVLSSSTNPEDRKKAISIPSVSEYLVKPITIEKIKQILEFNA